MRTFTGVFVVIMLLGFSVRADDFNSLQGHVTSQEQVNTFGNKTDLGIAEQQTVRVLSHLTVSLIEDFEQWVSTSYNDASHYCTIGYGHLIAKKPCAEAQVELAAVPQPMTTVAGLKLLDSDTTNSRLAVQNLVHEQLNDDQFGALTSFVFNVGGKNFANSSMLKYLNNGENDGAAKEFARWVKSDGKVLDGLIARRACEALLFNSQMPKGEFNRKNCSSLGAAPTTEKLIDIKTGELH